MATSIAQIDLSGIKGLAPRFQGNKAYTATVPQNLYLGSDGQMAGGIYNPLSQYGYLSPANDTVKNVTGTTSFLLTSAIVVPYELATGSTHAIFFTDEATTGTAGQVLELDTAVDTALANRYTIPTWPLYTFTFSADAVAATDVLTLTTSTGTITLANGLAVIYTAISFAGLTQNTTYYMGNVSGSTFKLYPTAGLVTPVNITVDSSGMTFISTTSVTEYSKSEDMIQYEVNGVPKIFFTRKNTTASGTQEAIAIADIDFSNPNPTWSNTQPVGASLTLLMGEGRTRFVLADNGFLYALNGNQVMKIDGGPSGGTNGTISQALVFLGKNLSSGVNTITRIIDGADIRGNIWMGIHVNTSFDTFTNSVSTKTIPMYVGVYIWDRQTTVQGNNNFIQIKGAKEFKSVHTLQGVPICFTTSTEGYTQLRVWNGVQFKLTATLGKNAYPAFQRHSVYEGDEYIIWLGNDGKIYCYGSVETGSPNGLYIIGDMSAHVTNGQTFSAGGVLVPANATESVTSGTQTEPLAFYLSYTDTSGNWLRKWYPHSVGSVASNAQVAHAGNVYSLVKYLPMMSTIKGVDIVCLPKGSAGDTTTVATLKIFVNQSTTASFTKTVTRSDISKGYLSYELNKPYVTSIQFKIEWDVSQTLGDNDFCPAYALLEYEPTRTR